jgi:hypothetical protein|tara:strand:+ start:204 stop:437 length:234 start_codon:yes stop_codon:yes gene_type:complete
MTKPRDAIKAFDSGYIEGFLEAVVLMYENDYIDIYQVEESLDYSSLKFSDLIPRLVDKYHISEAVEFVQDNYIGEDM